MIEKQGGIVVDNSSTFFTLSPSFVLLTICFVDARKENLSSSALIALLNAFINWICSKKQKVMCQNH